MAKGKTDRLIAIKDIISKNAIACQEDILLMLEKRGFNITQATLSRDIKELKIAKTPDANGKYRYMTHDTAYRAMSTQSESRGDLIRDSIYSIEFSSAVAVIKTKPGHASVTADIIDSRRPRQIMGTLAGDDTVLLILRDTATRENTIEELCEFIPDIDKRLI